MTKKLGVEIAVTGVVIENIPENLKFYDEILILCIDNAMKKKIMRQISGFDEETRSRVQVDLLKNHFIPL